MTQPFTETQRPRQWWIWLIVAVPVAIAVWAFVEQIILGHPFGAKPAPDMAIYVWFILMALVVCLLLSTRLDSRLDERGVHYRFVPFHLRVRSIRWSDISEAYVRSYRPIREYGGWGLRYGFGNGWVYNMSGRSGLQLVLRSGKKILIGTRRPDELKAYLTSIGKKTTS